MQRPPQIVALTEALMPRLLVGASQNHQRLRAQYERGSISEIDATGTGYYVRFDVPPDAPLADPETADGGPAAEAAVESDTLGSAGALLWLDRGRLSSLELYATDPWPPELPVRVGPVVPWRG